MSSYQGRPGGPRDPATPGPYCLSVCRCGTCPQYAEQQRQVEIQREQEYQARVRHEGQRWSRGQGKPAPVRAIRAQIQTAPTDTLTERFLAFDAANPRVRERLVELVEWHVSQGARRLGIGALFEELRGKVETTGRHYALDNSLRAPYVRALIADRPEFTDLFELRQRKAS